MFFFRQILFFSFLCFLLPYFGFAQDFQLRGQLVDSASAEPIISATVLLISQKDTTKRFGAVTDENGNFVIKNLKKRTYLLRIAYLGYRPIQQLVKMEEKDANLGVIRMAEVVMRLDEIKIETKQTRVEQLGDTTQISADAYKSNPDATAQDLITKMPGVTVENGTVKAQGENVQKVLVDGKPFFGDDPNAALKNLPADMISKVQIFDQASDQARFTGVNDGQQAKTINIVTKGGLRDGMFGRFYAGYGTDNRYQAGANFNFFKGDRRISILSMSNNINQQNFSSEDLVGAMGSSGGGRGGRGGGGGGRPGGYGYNPMNELMVGQQSGISTSHAVGLNYSDKWGKKITATASYFFNWSENEAASATNRLYFTQANNGLAYSENSLSNAKNMNHKFNLRAEYNIDSMNQIVFTPRFSWQQNRSNSDLFGQNVLEQTQQSQTLNNYAANRSGYSLSVNALYMHRFQKKGRAFSVNLRADANDKTGSANLYALNAFYVPIIDSIVTNQNGTTATDGYTLNANLNYSEPITQKDAIQITYEPEFTRNQTNKYTYNFDQPSAEYNLMDTLLTNVYDNDYMAHRAGVGWRREGEKLNFGANVQYQYASLNGEQEFPQTYALGKSFNNVLPSFRFDYKPKKGRSFMVRYRTYTQIPSVDRLQEVVNNANPLLLTTGNADLRQAFNQMLFTRYSSSNAEKATSFFVMLYATLGQNYVGNQTLIPTADTLLPNGIFIKQGAQLSRPVNINGYIDSRTYATYSLPLSKIKCNLNVNLGAGFNQTPGQINEAINDARTFNFNGGFALSSNISPKLDFTLTYSGNYNLVRNTLNVRANNNFFFQTGMARFRWNFWKGMFVDLQLNHTLYAGLAAGYNQNFQLLNVSLGYKFLKDNALEVKATLFDALNQNNSVQRNVTETYIEDQTTRVLNRYGILTVAYTLKKFNTGGKPANVAPQNAPEGEKRRKPKTE